MQKPTKRPEKNYNGKKKKIDLRVIIFHSLFVDVFYSSSDELVKERYAVQAIPITDTNG